MIRLVVVDDHPAIAAAIADAARGHAEIELVGRASDAAEGIALVEDTQPDVVICDVWLGGEPGGLELARRF